MTGSLVFITGASGFIGSQVVLDTLKAGHRVRVNVRRDDQIGELTARFSPAVSSPGQLEFVVNPDISDSKAVGSAMNNVEYIFHLASPMPNSKDSDFKTGYLKPAVKGTEAILAAAALASSVKRVVIVSSLLAFMPLGSLQVPGFVVDESATIKVDPDMTFPEGPAGGGVKYSASKILAHRATLDWMAENKPQFALVTLHPTFVVGHDYTQKSATISGAAVNSWILGSLASGTPVMPGQLVDVRDVSAAHIAGINAPLDPNVPLTEVQLLGPTMNWEAVVKVVKAKYPSIPCKMTEEGPYPAPFVGDNTRAEREFGIKWHSVEESISSLLDQQLGFREKAGL